MLGASDLRSRLTVAGVPFNSVDVEGALDVVVRVRPTSRDDVMRYLRDELGFAQLLDLFGADIEAKEATEDVPASAGYIEVTYLMRSMEHDSDLWVKMQLPYAGEYRSVIGLFGSALLSERELCEMFGLVLLGHPNPKRLVTNPHFPHPLLKSVGIRGRDEVWKAG